MALLVYLFGLPASGKSHAGQLLVKHFGFQFIEGDDCLSADMLAALQAGRELTPEQHTCFRNTIGDKVAAQLATNLATPTPRNIVVAQRSYKNIHRENFVRRFPTASIWHVIASDSVRAERVSARTLSSTGSVAASTGYHQDSKGFQPPTHPCETLVNDGRTDSLLIERMRALLATLRGTYAAATTGLASGSVLTFSGIDRRVCDIGVGRVGIGCG